MARVFLWMPVRNSWVLGELPEWAVFGVFGLWEEDVEGSAGGVDLGDEAGEVFEGHGGAA